MTLSTAITFATVAVQVATIVLALWTANRWRREATEARATALIVLDMLEQMDLARDPGREVHQRLASAFEAGMVATEGGPNVGMRRAAAMAIAADIIKTVDRADLEIVPRSQGEP